LSPRSSSSPSGVKKSIASYNLDDDMCEIVAGRLCKSRVVAEGEILKCA